MTEPPAPLLGAPAVLGALGPGLRRLAELQGGWPPHAPLSPRTPPAPASSAEGAASADAAADEGVDLLVVEGAADAGTAVGLLAALLGLEPVHAVGTGGGPGWAAQVAAVRAALPRLRPLATNAPALLAAVEDTPLGGLTGLLGQAARRRTPVLLGSSAEAAAALLLADRLAPGTARWVLPGCSSSVPAATRALELLGLTPLLDLRLPGPGGALLATRVLDTALELLRA